MKVELPWPPSALRANSHKHWRSRQTAAKLYKSICLIDLREQGLGKLGLDKLHLTLVFHQPDKRRADLDGHLSAAKWGIDAIAETVGIDDQHFGFTILRGEPVKGGKVVATLSEV